MEKAIKTRKGKVKRKLRKNKTEKIWKSKVAAQKWKQKLKNLKSSKTFLKKSS